MALSFHLKCIVLGTEIEANYPYKVTTRLDPNQLQS